MIEIARGIAIGDDELVLKFVHSSGPGGQNVNKVATAVQLRFDIRNSPSLTPELKEILSLVQPGGIILFKRNVENPHQLAQLSADIQKEVYGKEEFPLFVAIDQEGGVVTRLVDPFTQFSSQGELGDAGYDQVFKRGSTMAYE